MNLKQIRASNPDVFNTDKDNPDHTFHGKSYLDIFDLYLYRLIKAQGNVLEVGVRWGGFLRMLRRYFPQGEIHGLDIDPYCKVHESIGEKQFIHVCDQSDPKMLTSIAEKHGPFKFINDDGSHVVDHIISTFETLWPALTPRGIYIIEDTRIAYDGVDGGWPGMQFNRPGTLTQNVRKKFDDLFLGKIKEMDYFRGDISAVHFHPMVVVIEKV